MAARTGRGISPSLGVRLPKHVFSAIHAIARQKRTTAAFLVRECVMLWFEYWLFWAPLPTETLEPKNEVNLSGETKK